MSKKPRGTGKDSKLTSADMKETGKFVMIGPANYVPCPHKSIVVNPEVCRLNSTYPDRLVLSSDKPSSFAMEHCAKCFKWRRYLHEDSRWPVQKEERKKFLVGRVKLKRCRSPIQQVVLKKKKVVKNVRCYPFVVKRNRLFTSIMRVKLSSQPIAMDQTSFSELAKKLMKGR